MAVVTPVERAEEAPEVREALEGMVQKYGRIPNIFGTMAKRPSILKHFLPFYGSVVAEGTVEARYKELAYLKTSIVNGCQYWTQAHTASAKRIGITDAQIQALTFYRFSDQFDEKEQAVILYTDQVTRGAAALREPALEALRKHFSEEQIVELTLVICAANFTNRFNDSLQVVPDLGWRLDRIRARVPRDASVNTIAAVGSSSAAGLRPA